MSKERAEKKPPMVAIEYSEQNETLPVTAQPRQPRNLQDLLRYSTEAASALGGVTSSNSPRTLDDESKQFLEQAVKSMSVNVVEELLKDIAVLQGASSLLEDGDPTECEVAFDHIFDYVDNLDVANDFHKIGGFCVFTPCLKSVHSSLRWRGAELVAELCQNNPYCQEKVLEIGLMPSLLKMVDMDSDDTVKIKALYAVSCLIRENEIGFNQFVESDGLSVLLRALRTNVQKLNIKSAFLLSSLCRWKPYIIDKLVNMGYVEQLICQLATHIGLSNEEHPSSVEHLLNAILDIVKDHRLARDITKRPDYQFKFILNYIVENSEENDQYKEENKHAKDLINLIFGETWKE